MPTVSEVKARIEASIPGASAEVQSPDNVHFSARVVADAFAGLSRIQQHRLVYAAFDGELGGEIHALQLKTETP
jgi:stress-induced morphogen